MRLLVTGGAGFIGSHFIRLMLEEENQVCCVDKLTYAADLTRLAECRERPLFSFVQADICDSIAMRAAFEAFQPQAVVNFAAQTHVDRSFSAPLDFIRDNVQGTGVLLEECRRGNIPFHQVSTDEVYGPAALGQTQGQEEEAPLLPSSPYAASKAAADLLALSYFHTWGLPVTITRSCNNFGEGQHREKLIPMVVFKALRGEPIPVYGDGRQRRCWISAREHCRVIAAVLERGRPGEIYNVPFQAEVENLALIQKILDWLGCSHRFIEFVEDRPGHDRRYQISAEKIRRELAVTLPQSFEEELEACIRWYARTFRDANK